MIEIKELEQVGVEAVLAAGALLRERYRTRFAVAQKGVINLVTEIDLAAEELIVSKILKAFPDHVILAEERHNHSQGGEIRWIIDPLDGTTNYAHGYQDFSVSIGVEIAGEVAWGAVYDPMRDELFTARKGAGAWCNGEPLTVSSVKSLDESLLATGFPYDIRTDRQKNLAAFCAFAVRCHGVRRSGSAALDLCHTAAGRLDGFWERKLNPWDCAAGYLAVREAGGDVTQYSGQQGTIYDKEVIASNGLIHEEIKAVLEGIEE
jgi:myo-inositol-1(or 4)-monophosphatase